MRRSALMFLVLIVAVVAMAFSGAGACEPGTVGGDVLAAAGGDPTGGQIETALADADTALNDVEAATGQDIPVC